MTISLTHRLPAQILFAIVVLCSCKKEYSYSAANQPSRPNLPPVAVAGNDRTLIYPDSSLILDGTASFDPDGNIDHFEWTEISGPSTCNIQTPNASRTSVSNLVLGDYRMLLKVTDAGGLSSTDTVVISVVASHDHWLQRLHAPENEFFFGPRDYFAGSNLLMGINNQVFALNNHGQLWSYDNGVDSWTMIGVFPELLQHEPIVFSVGNKGYCIGDGHCWQYDPALNSWSRKNDPPYNFQSPLVINNKVYLQNNNQFYSYDPQTDSYTQKNNLPFSSTGLLGFFVVNGEGFYVNGGYQCWKYYVATDSWQQKASLAVPGQISHSSSFSLNNYGYIIGDLNFLSYNNSLPMKVWRYNAPIDQWQQFSEDYPGFGAYDITTAFAGTVVYVGLGYSNADFNAIDFWRFND